MEYDIRTTPVKNLPIEQVYLFVSALSKNDVCRALTEYDAWISEKYELKDPFIMFLLNTHLMKIKEKKHELIKESVKEFGYGALKRLSARELKKAIIAYDAYLQSEYGSKNDRDPNFHTFYKENIGNVYIHPHHKIQTKTKNK